MLAHIFNVTFCYIHSKRLPEVEPGRHVANDLDRQLRSYREAELAYIHEEATRLRTTATDINEVLHEVENYLALLRNMAVEPQNSMPDVIIWMLSGEKRVAYFRCPAHHVLWSPDPAYRGKYCGQLSTIQLKVRTIWCLDSTWIHSYMNISSVVLSTTQVARACQTVIDRFEPCRRWF